jgi:cell wall-associated NlpC family hydrolase
MTDLLPGDIALVTNHNFAASTIRLGDWLKCKRLGLTHNSYNHAAIYVGHGKVVEAEPKGACSASIDDIGDIDWYRLKDASPWGPEVAANHALDFVGVSYSWLDIGALALDDIGWNVQSDDKKLTRIGKRIASSKSVICSALVVRAYQAAGVDLLPGQMAGEVSPADLGRCALLERIS